MSTDGQVLVPSNSPELPHASASPLTLLVVGHADALALNRPVLAALERGARVILASESHSPTSYKHPGLTRVLLPTTSGSSDGIDFDERTGKAVRMLRALVREHAPDVIHVHAVDRLADLCRIARLHPVMLSVWGFLNNLLTTQQAAPLPRWMQSVIQSASLVIAESPLLVERVCEEVTSSVRIEHLPLGVNVQLFRPDPRSRTRWRRALGIAEDAYVFFSARGFGPGYNQELIFDAFVRACAQVDHALVLLFVRLGRESRYGESATAMRKMEARVEEAGLGDSVRWVPALAHPMMAGLYSSADALISYPDSDAFPSTLIEAAACQLPILSAALPSYRGTFIEEGATCIEPNNLDALTEAMIAHASGCVTLDVERTRALVVAEFDETRCMEQLITLYREIAGTQPSPRPKVSVLIATFNRADRVDRAIDSVLAQTMTDFELIVVDDGSTDDTASVLAAYGQALTVVNKANGGLASARNAGCRVACGHYVAFLDDDDTWAPDFLAIQTPILEADEATDVVYGDMIYVDEEGRRLGESSCFGDRPPAPGTVHPEFLFLYNSIPGGAVLVRWTALAEVGFFDPTLRTAEDYDLWLRLSERGERTFRRVDREIAQYCMHASNISRTATAQMLHDLVRVREKAFDRSERIRQMQPILLDRCLFDLYLRLAGDALEAGQRKEARAELERFRQRRGETDAWRALFLACRD